MKNDPWAAGTTADHQTGSDLGMTPSGNKAEMTGRATPPLGALVALPRVSVACEEGIDPWVEGGDPWAAGARDEHHVARGRPTSSTVGSVNEAISKFDFDATTCRLLCTLPDQEVDKILCSVNSSVRNPAAYITVAVQNAAKRVAGGSLGSPVQCTGPKQWGEAACWTPIHVSNRSAVFEHAVAGSIPCNAEARPLSRMALDEPLSCVPPDSLSAAFSRNVWRDGRLQQTFYDSSEIIR